MARDKHTGCRATRLAFGVLVAVLATGTVIDAPPDVQASSAMTVTINVTSTGGDSTFYYFVDFYYNGCFQQVVSVTTVNGVGSTNVSIPACNGTGGNAGNIWQLGNGSNDPNNFNRHSDFELQPITCSAVYFDQVSWTGLWAVNTYETGSNYSCTFANIAPDISVTKAVQVPPAYNSMTGFEEVTYKVDVATTADWSNATNAYSLTDQFEFPNGVTVEDVDVSGEAEGDTSVNSDFDGGTDTDLASGVVSAGDKTDSYLVTVTYSGDAPGDTGLCEEEGGLFNSVAVDGTHGSDEDATCADLPGADLSVNKKVTAGVGAANGEEITYSVEVRNAGPDTASNVVVTDTLPMGLDYVSADGDNMSCSFSAPTITCTAASFAPSADPVDTIIVTARVRGDLLVPTELTNTAQVDAATSDPDTSNNSNSAETTTDVTMIVLDKFVDNHFFGDADSSEFPLSVTKVEDLNDVDLQASPSLSELTLADERVTGSDPDDADSFPDENLTLGLPVPVDATPGDGQNLAAYVIQETQQTGYSLEAGWSCAQHLESRDGPLSALIESPVDVYALADPTAAVVLIAPGQHVYCHIINEDQAPDLFIEKIVADEDETVVAGGGNVAYTISVTNDGGHLDPEESVPVSDTLPQGFSWADVPDFCDIGGDPMVCSLDPDDLEPGETFTFDVTAHAGPSAPSGIATNIAWVDIESDPLCGQLQEVPFQRVQQVQQVSDCTPFCPDFSEDGVQSSLNISLIHFDNVDCADIAVIRTATLGLTKTDDTSSAPHPGDSFNYALIVTNNGPSSILHEGVSPLRLDDTLPAGLELVSVSASAPWDCNAVSPIVCIYGAELVPGAAPTVTVRVRVAADFAGDSVSNTATATGIFDLPASPETFSLVADPNSVSATATRVTPIAHVVETTTTSTTAPPDTTAAPPTTSTTTAPPDTTAAPTTTVDVNAGGPTPPQLIELPETGSDSADVLWLAFAALAFGLVATLAVRRRSTS